MKYNGDNLIEVLRCHKKWMTTDEGKRNEADRASFEGGLIDNISFVSRVLDGANFNHASIRNTEFIDCDLRGASFVKAEFTGCRFSGSTFKGSHFIDASFDACNMVDTSFCFTAFTNSVIRNTLFIECMIDDANFDDVILWRSVMLGGYMEQSRLTGTQITGGSRLDSVILKSSKDVPNLPMECPSEGSFIGWKKCTLQNGMPCIVKLLIPKDAKRSSATGNKCRCSRAKVLDIRDEYNAQYKTAYSKYERDFEYKIGETVEPANGFCEDRYEQCAPGIHFFMRKEDAIEYI